MACLPAIAAAFELRPLVPAWLGGDLPQAVYHYEQAIQYDPADAAARFNYGSLLVRKGDGAHAVPHLLLAAESSNPAVRQAALRLLAEISASKPIR